VADTTEVWKGEPLLDEVSAQRLACVNGLLAAGRTADAGTVGSPVAGCDPDTDDRNAARWDGSSCTGAPEPTGPPEDAVSNAGVAAAAGAAAGTDEAEA
jgi:hypothetical protein